MSPRRQKQQCAHGHDANELYVHGACHPQSPTWACVEQDTNTLRIECAECGKLIVRFLVTGPLASVHPAVRVAIEAALTLNRDASIEEG